MAQAQLAPLPPDYVRPSREEFNAARITHVTYEEFFERHEAELRKHAVPAVAAPAPLAQVDADPSLEPEPAWQYETDERGIIIGGGPPPAAEPVEASVNAEPTELAAPPASAAVRALPAGYVRPSLEQFVAAGYLRRTPPEERQAAYVKFFEEYELARYGTTASAPAAPVVDEAPWRYETDERGIIIGGGPPPSPANPAENAPAVSDVGSVSETA